MAVKDKHRGGLSCFLIVFRCNVIHFVNSLFVFEPGGRPQTEKYAFGLFLLSIGLFVGIIVSNSATTNEFMFIQNFLREHRGDLPPFTDELTRSAAAHPCVRRGPAGA